MLKWLLGLLWNDGSCFSPSQETELALLLDERARLAETLACYREFGFDAQAESCKIRLHGLARRIREIRTQGGGGPARSEGGGE